MITPTFSSFLQFIFPLGCGGLHEDSTYAYGYSTIIPGISEPGRSREVQLGVFMIIFLEQEKIGNGNEKMSERILARKDSVDILSATCHTNILKHIVSTHSEAFSVL